MSAQHLRLDHQPVQPVRGRTKVALSPGAHSGPAPTLWSRRPDVEVTTMSNGSAGAAAGGGAIYGLGIFGALVYFWQQADAFWAYVLAIVQGLFWPAFMVYEVFRALGA
jgi:hypothetical protein